MSLPRQIQQAEEEANNLIKGNTSNEAPKEDVQTQPPTQSQETPQEATPPATSDDGIDWKAKYQVLQGKYNKEVPTLTDKVKALESNALAPNEAVESLKQEIATLRQDLAQAKQQEVAKSEITLNQHLVDEYGEDFAQAVAESASVQVEAVRNEFNQKFSRQEQDISEWTTESKMAAVKQQLNSLNIDFNMVDTDPLFVDWLNQADDYSGMSRHSMLMDAFNNGDLSRVVRFYSAFVDSSRNHAQEHPFNQHIEAQPSAAMDSGTTQPVFDPDAFAELHRRYQRGLIGDDEFAQKERELYAAMSMR